MRTQPSSSGMWWALVTALVLVARTAAAQPQQPPPQPQQPRQPQAQPQPGRPTLRQAQTALESTDAASVRSGIAQCGAIGGAGAVQALAARIRDGLTPELLDLAMGQLVALRRPEAGGILGELVQYRRPEVRRKAIEAIVATNATSAETALVGALGDADPTVRGAAARALGRIGARRSLPALFAAFERGLTEAAGAIGVLARPAQVARILGYLDTQPFSSVGPALAELLRRRDVPAATRIAAIGEIATHNVADVRGFLQQLVAALPEGDAVRTAADRAIASLEQSESEPAPAPPAGATPAPPPAPAPAPRSTPAPAPAATPARPAAPAATGAP